MQLGYLKYEILRMFVSQLLRATQEPPQDIPGHIPTTDPDNTRIGRPRIDSDATQGAAGIMRSGLAKHVASILNLQPVSYESTYMVSLLHGPLGPS